MNIKTVLFILIHLLNIYILAHIHMPIFDQLVCYSTSIMFQLRISDHTMQILSKVHVAFFTLFNAVCRYSVVSVYTICMSAKPIQKQTKYHVCWSTRDSKSPTLCEHIAGYNILKNVQKLCLSEDISNYNKHFP